MAWRTTIVNGQKQCKYCLSWKNIKYFGFFLDKINKNGTRKRYINSRCKKCASKVSREWTRDHKEMMYQRWKEKRKFYLNQIRSHYGNKCACCEESNPLFLTIDHINNDGFKLRPRNKNSNVKREFYDRYYGRIIKQGFPTDLQLLCWNCNCGKARNNGICPHKI